MFPVPESLTPTLIGTFETNHPVAMPATVDSGDMLIVFFSNHGGTHDPPTEPTGWTELHNTQSDSPGNSNRLGTYYKIADGTEGGTSPVWVTSVVRKSVSHVYRISGWHGTTPPEISTPTIGDTTTEADAGSLTPSWGSADTLWLVAAGYDADITTMTAYPTDFTDGSLSWTDTSDIDCGLASARRELAAASLDPAAFDLVVLRSWVSVLVAVPGAGGFDPVNLVAAILSDDVTLTWGGVVRDFNALDFDVDDFS